MDSIHWLSSIGRQIKLFQNKLICLRKLFQPFTNCNLKGIRLYIIKNSSSWLILIRSDIRSLTIILILLLSKFLLPHILVHLRANNSTI